MKTNPSVTLTHEQFAAIMDKIEYLTLLVQRPAQHPGGSRLMSPAEAMAYTHSPSVQAFAEFCAEFKVPSCKCCSSFETFQVNKGLHRRNKAQAKKPVAVAA